MHEACARTLAEADPLAISPFVLAELDYLTARIAGVDAELSVLAEMSSGAFEIAGFDAVDLVRAHSVIERYRDPQLALTDASLVVLAAKYGGHAIATFDERRFGVLQSLSGKPFRLLSADIEH